VHESERNRLIKRQQALLLALVDMAHAVAALGALEREHLDVNLMRALETAIAVSYARPFVTSSLLRLRQADYRPADPEQSELHGDLLDLRDKVYAHTDRDSGRTARIEITSATGLGNLGGLPASLAAQVHEQWIPLSRAKIPGYRILIEGQAQRFGVEAAGIQMQLDA
jgi:hypothetical protein